MKNLIRYILESNNNDTLFPQNDEELNDLCRNTKWNSDLVDSGRLLMQKLAKQYNFKNQNSSWTVFPDHCDSLNDLGVIEIYNELLNDYIHSKFDNNCAGYVGPRGGGFSLLVMNEKTKSKERELLNVTYDYKKNFVENICILLSKLESPKLTEESKSQETPENPVENAAKEHAEEIKDILKLIGLTTDDFKNVNATIKSLLSNNSKNENLYNTFNYILESSNPTAFKKFIAHFKDDDSQNALTVLLLAYKSLKNKNAAIKPDVIRAFLSIFDSINKKNK